MKLSLAEQTLILDKLDTLTAESTTAGSLSVHSLVCHNHLLYYLFSIKTFLKFSGLECRIFVYNDGSLSADAIALIQSHVKNIEVIQSEDPRIEQNLRGFPLCREFLRTNLFARRLFGILAFTPTDQFLVLDSDILFLNRPIELVQWAAGNKTPQSLFGTDPSPNECVALGPVAFQQLGSRFVPHFNVGLLCTTRSLFDLEIIEKTLELIKARDRKDGNWVFEQTVWAVLLGRQPLQGLPPQYFMRGLDNTRTTYRLEDLITVHYSHGKEAMLTEGVRFLIESGRI